MIYLLVFVQLALFWLVLSGHFTPLLLGFGLLSVVLVLWLLRRMDRIDGEPVMSVSAPGLLLYLVWLLWAVVKTNIDLARRILHPALPVRPVWGRLDIRVESPLEKTLYANSITLTPGTLTTDVRDDHFLIHAVTPEALEELRRGDMERRIRRIGF
jgi:multicomponent Na+:H+ antiporter subunit E